MGKVLNGDVTMSVHGSNVQQHLLEEEDVGISIGIAGESKVHGTQTPWKT